MKLSKLCLAAFIFSLVLAACRGQGTLSVEDAWARPGRAASNSAVYFRIDNPTNRADTLLGASSTVAGLVEIHLSMMGADETMSMHPQDEVPVPGRSQVTFEPGGLHLMLVDLHRDLLEGDQFELVLHFQGAGDITLQVPVEQR